VVSLSEGDNWKALTLGKLDTKKKIAEVTARTAAPSSYFPLSTSTSIALRTTSGSFGQASTIRAKAGSICELRAKARPQLEQAMLAPGPVVWA